eukprot:11187414-Lingulodinium_polyedra.AAC.1
MAASPERREPEAVGAPSVPEPILSDAERAQRLGWSRVPAEVRKMIRQLRVSFGRPTNAALTRLVRRRG